MSIVPEDTNPEDTNPEEPEPAKPPLLSILPSDTEPLIVKVLDIYGKVFVVVSLIIFSWQFLSGPGPYRSWVAPFFTFITSVFSAFLVLGLVAILRILLRIETLLERNQRNGTEK